MDYRISFDDDNAATGQEAFTITFDTGRSERVALWDYDRIYEIPGLYEEVVQRRLRCASPAKIAEALMTVAEQDCRDPAELRVLDLGAGNGVVGEQLRARGVRVIVGTDSAQRPLR